jgi:hypothetical protein
LVIGATEVHPVSSRTRSLRPSAPMVLGGRPPGRVGHCQEAFSFNPPAVPDEWTAVCFNRALPAEPRPAGGAAVPAAPSHRRLQAPQPPAPQPHAQSSPLLQSPAHPGSLFGDKAIFIYTSPGINTAYCHFMHRFLYFTKSNGVAHFRRLKTGISLGISREITSRQSAQR